MKKWRVGWRTKHGGGGERGGYDFDMVSTVSCVGGGRFGTSGTGPTEVVFEVGVGWVAGWGGGGGGGGGAGAERTF